MWSQVLIQASQTVASPVRPEPTPEALARFATGVKAAVDLSAGLNAWALAVLGGTLVVLMSTSYRKPTRPMRFVFLLVLPSLALLARALERGSYASRAYAALVLQPPSKDATLSAVSKVNEALDGQIWAFKYAIVLLGIWLLAYVLWWIFVDEDQLSTSAEGRRWSPN